ncbi:MAG: hypothetical protein DCF32_15540 [Leptolyngbya sp.]|nr:MAG: hypothetical protein DCF32_15540 [Leptolyngbya sp.]
MHTSELQWSSEEKTLAKAAIATAYSREISGLVQVVRDRASSLTSMDDLWQLHDFLSARRHELDGKYDDRESALLFVFSSLVREGWLSLDELKGLDTAKLSKITALTRMF